MSRADRTPSRCPSLGGLPWSLDSARTRAYAIVRQPCAWDRSGPGRGCGAGELALFVEARLIQCDELLCTLSTCSRPSASALHACFSCPPFLRALWLVRCFLCLTRYTPPVPSRARVQLGLSKNRPKSGGSAAAAKSSSKASGLSQGKSQSVSSTPPFDKYVYVCVCLSVLSLFCASMRAFPFGEPVLVNHD